MLTIFYDGACPLCAREMDALKRHDSSHAIQLEDIHQPGFTKRFPDVDPAAAMKILHGNLDGKALLGLDVTYHAWRLVGQEWRVVYLRWRWLKPFADRAYLFFAKHRQQISKMFVRRSSCDTNACNK
ncbi:thiol-disulfide oxidoreductase DCC family protein [Photobacterium sp. DNB22_13_2]